MVFAAIAAAGVFLRPAWWDVVFYVQSSGANEVHVPVGFWLTAALWMVAVAQASGLALRRIAPRAVLIACATHLLLLLALSAPILDDPSAFTTSSYQWYARLFHAVMLAAGVVWSGRVAERIQSLSASIAVPVLLATAVLAVQLFRIDPFSVLIAGIAGFMAWRSMRDQVPMPERLRALWSNERAFMLAIFVIAVVLRVLYLQRVMSNPGYLETGADGPVYDELAWSIAQGRGIRASFTERFPLLLLGYVWFVSAIYTVAGHSYFAVGAVQAVIGAAACVLFYSVARELCGRPIARIAALFAAISFPLLFASAAIGHQAIDVFLTMVIVWMLVKGTATAQWSWWRWCALGALFGIAIAVRETVTFFLAFVLLWIPFLFPRPFSARAVGAAALVVLAAFATIAPLAIPKVATATQRDKLRHHFDILYRGEADPIRMRDDIVAPLSNPDAALAQLRESPGLVLSTLGRAWASNFAVQFFAQPYGGFDLVFLRKGTAYYYALWFYAYALAIGGVIILLRELRIGPHAAGIVLVLGLIASRTVPHLILESNYRHRVPIEPFLILLAAVGVVRLISAAKRTEAMA